MTTAMATNSSVTESEEAALQLARACTGTTSMIAGAILATSCHSAAQRTFDRQRKVMLHIVLHMAIFDMLYGASFSPSWVTDSEIGGSTVARVFCDISLGAWCLGSMSALYTALLAWFVHRSIAEHAAAPAWRTMRMLLIGTYTFGLAWWAATLLASPGGAYSCTQYESQSSFGIWGGIAYSCYAASLFAVLVYIAVMFFRIRRAFRAARSLSRGMLEATERMCGNNRLDAGGRAASSEGGSSPRSRDDEAGATGAVTTRQSPSNSTERRPSSGGGATTEERLDWRLVRYLLAYLVCNLPAVAETVALILVQYKVVARAPFALIALRWTLQPLQGVANLLVYWNQAAREDDRKWWACCTDMRATVASSDVATAIERISSYISGTRDHNDDD